MQGKKVIIRFPQRKKKRPKQFIILVRGVSIGNIDTKYSEWECIGRGDTQGNIIIRRARGRRRVRGGGIFYCNWDHNIIRLT